MPSHEQFANALYTSRKWRKCRAEFLKTRQGLCERCQVRGLFVPATQVHHKVKLTVENMQDPTVTLNFENLEALCDDCHQQEHSGKRWRVLEDGTVII